MLAFRVIDNNLVEVWVEEEDIFCVWSDHCGQVRIGELLSDRSNQGRGENNVANSIGANDENALVFRGRQ